MVGKRIGGINVFGGGLALYDATGELIGAVGVSGDTSCADHNIAWKVRDALVLDYVPGGVDPLSGTDNIVYDIQPDGTSPSGWGHPECAAASTTIGKNLPNSNPVSPPPNASRRVQLGGAGTELTDESAPTQSDEMIAAVEGEANGR